MKQIIAFFKRRHNAIFYLTLAAQLILVIQLLLAVFGHGDWITEALKNRIMAFVEGLLSLFSLFGVVNNPITQVLPSTPEVIAPTAANTVATSVSEPIATEVTATTTTATTATTTDTPTGGQ